MINGYIIFHFGLSGRTDMSLRTTSISVMRPPKPPSWRDFVNQEPKNIPSVGHDLPDPIGRSLGARSPISDLIETSLRTASVPGNRVSRLPRRPRARIHRTRSEHVIETGDLPESIITATLAEADPKGSRTRRPGDFDCRLYDEENTRRCQSWLASIEACEPLDEVDYASDTTISDSPRTTPEPEIQIDVYKSKTFIDDSLTRLRDDNETTQHRADDPNPRSIPIHDLSQAVDVEIPEETFIWTVPREVRPPSASSGEDCCCSCTRSSTIRGDDKKKAATDALTTANSGIKTYRINVDKMKKGDDIANKHCGLKSFHRQTNEYSETPSKKKHSTTKASSSLQTNPSCDVDETTDKNVIGGSPRIEVKQSDKSLGSISEGDRHGETKLPLTMFSSPKRTSSQSVLCDTDLWALDQSD